MRFTKTYFRQKGSVRRGLIPGLLLGGLVYALLLTGIAAMMANGTLELANSAVLSRLAFGAAALPACWITAKGSESGKLGWSLLCAGLLTAAALIPALLQEAGECRPGMICGIAAAAALLGAVLGARGKRRLV